MSEREYREQRRERVEAEMDGQWRDYYQAFDTCNREYAKWERYYREQQVLLRELEDLKASERQMYELDDSKDQMMTTLKLAPANLAIWARDTRPSMRTPPGVGWLRSSGLQGASSPRRIV